MVQATVAFGSRTLCRPTDADRRAAFGLQGLALYNFETQATAFFGENGQNALRLEGEYDILLTNRLILQPSAEANFYSRNDPGRRIGSGLANLEAGLRLRYEIVPEFAPYLGVTWSNAYGTTADYTGADGDPRSEARFVTGVRL
nr:copper resistance protein B [Pseudomonas sp. Pse1]